MSATEEWRPIVGFEGLYEVSNLGRARSLDRWLTFTRRGATVSQFKPGQPVALSPHTKGYLMLHLYKDGVRTPVLLHRAVMEAFVGPRPPGLEILHGDGVRTHCALSNLRYGTKAENTEDRFRHGTVPRGEQTVAAKLTADNVREIRRRVGEPIAQLAEEFGCHFSNISAIQLRKSWRHV